MFLSAAIETKEETPLRVLIADDDHCVLAVINNVTRYLGHLVVGTATNGRECIQRASELRPDLVIVDLTLPDLDGIQTAEAIRKNSAVPIIITSGASGEEISKRLKRTAVAGYLTKPFNLDQVKTAISAARGVLATAR